MNSQSLRQIWKITNSWFKSALAVALIAAFLISSANAQTTAVTVQGTGVGPIPDQPDPAAPCQTPGPPLNVTFNVAGLTANVSRVEVDVTMTHTWGGDVVATLIAPSSTRQLDLFGYTGATTATGSGDSSDLGGPYTFSDTATGGWWAAATAAGATAPIPAGSYRTSQRGGAGSTGAATSLDTTFGGLTPAQANGTWTLRFTDGCNLDTGSVSAATLRIFTGAPPQVTPKPFFDFYGTNRTSFVTFSRPTGGNITWRIANNGGAGSETVQWGLSTDQIAVGYFDADNRADLNVYRIGNPQGTASNVYYIRQSSNNTLNAVYYGSGTGDFAGYEADYDGDGRTDPTVIRRSGGNWVWAWQSSSTGAVRQIPFGAQSGNQNTDDIPVAGADFSGDGRADLIAVRRDASGNMTWYIGDSQTGATLLVQPWGNYNTDYIVLGDYIGDARADFVVWRGFGSTSNAVWYIRENGGTGTFATQFGIAGVLPTTGDYPVVGDYNGDGKSDIAVWRPSNQTFYWLNSPTTAASTLGVRQWGNAGDTPLGFFKVF